MKGSNDSAVNPDVVRSVRLEELHRIASRAVALQRRTWRLVETAGQWLVFSGCFGLAYVIGAALNHNWGRALALSAWPLGCGVLAAVFWRSARALKPETRRLKALLMQWETEEVRRRLGD